MATVRDQRAEGDATPPGRGGPRGEPAAGQGGVAPAVSEPSSRAVIVTLAPESAWTGAGAVVIDAIAPAPRATDLGAGAGSDDETLVNGVPVLMRLERRDEESAVLVRGAVGERSAVGIRLLPERLAGSEWPGVRRREVLVDGWRVVVDVEPAARARLRKLARRGEGATGQSGPTQVRAMIPGIVLAVMADQGEAVEAGQVLIVVEAMKMQNEIRAPRSGTVERVMVQSGGKIEVGDVLVSLA